LSGLGLALRSLLWTLLLPGMVAGYIPWRYYGVGRLRPRWSAPEFVLGLVVVGSGAALLLACIWEFARRGRGTLSPVDPPTELVARGLYRYVRNPMYLSVATILLGELLLAPSRDFLLYGAIVFALFNLAVIFYEEPSLRRRFGASYQRYLREVPRWIPRPPRRLA